MDRFHALIFVGSLCMALISGVQAVHPALLESSNEYASWDECNYQCWLADIRPVCVTISTGTDVLFASQCQMEVRCCAERAPRHDAIPNHFQLNDRPTFSPAVRQQVPPDSSPAQDEVHSQPKRELAGLIRSNSLSTSELTATCLGVLAANFPRVHRRVQGLFAHPFRPV